MSVEYNAQKLFMVENIPFVSGFSLPEMEVGLLIISAALWMIVEYVLVMCMYNYY